MRLEPWIALVAAVLAVVASALATVVTGRRVFLLTTATLSAAGLSALAFLLVLSRHETDVWTYYPLKLLWILLIVFGVALFACTAILAARMRHRVLRVAAWVLVVALAAGAGVWRAPPEFNGYRHRSAPEVVLGIDRQEGSRAITGELLRLADSEQLTIRWKSSMPQDDEGILNLWLLQLYSGSLAGDDELRLLGYWIFRNPDPELLCRIDELAGGVVVETADAGLAEELAEVCPGNDIEIRPETPR